MSGSVTESPSILRGQLDGWTNAWNRFWFLPQLPDTLCALRIATGFYLLYINIIWLLHSAEFFGPTAWINSEIIRQLHAQDHTWSYLWGVESSTALTIHHLVMIALSLCFFIGAGTRVVGPIVWFMQLMYVHRLTGALFGLDQVVTMLLMYLAFAPCNARWSVDAWCRGRRASDTRTTGFWSWLLPSTDASVMARICTRLLQVHLCIIYLFGGISKMRGEMWWDGTALWFAVASYEYQSYDLTWLAHHPVLFSAITNATVFWEAFYPALVWPRLTRPWVLGMAVLVHGGIAVAMGMITFGTAMIVANASFVCPDYVRRKLPLKM